MPKKNLKKVQAEDEDETTQDVDADADGDTVLSKYAETETASKEKSAARKELIKFLRTQPNLECELGGKRHYLHKVHRSVPADKLHAHVLQSEFDFDKDQIAKFKSSMAEARKSLRQFEETTDRLITEDLSISRKYPPADTTDAADGDAAADADADAAAQDQDQGDEKTSSKKKKKAGKKQKQPKQYGKKTAKVGDDAAPSDDGNGNGNGNEDRKKKKKRKKSKANKDKDDSDEVDTGQIDDEPASKRQKSNDGVPVDATSIATIATGPTAPSATDVDNRDTQLKTNNDTEDAQAGLKALVEKEELTQKLAAGSSAVSVDTSTNAASEGASAVTVSA